MNKVSHDIMLHSPYAIMFRSSTELSSRLNTVYGNIPIPNPPTIEILNFETIQNIQTQYSLPQKISVCTRRTKHPNLLSSLTSSV